MRTGRRYRFGVLQLAYTVLLTVVLVVGGGLAGYLAHRLLRLAP